MSDESTSSAEKASAVSEPTPKVRRISNKNPKKAVKAAKEKKAANDEVPIEEFDSTPPASDDARGDSGEGSGEVKRKNRRRRGKGKPSPKEGESSAEAVSEETISLGDLNSSESSPQSKESSRNSRDSNHRQENQGGRKEQQIQRPPQNQRNKPDSNKIAKNAWKIFLAEVSEEGVALIGDNDARELTRRCFRLAEIFAEEEGRRN